MIQVYTDKLPESCWSCKTNIDDGACCPYIDGLDVDGYTKHRHERCPLITWKPGTTAPKDGKPFLIRNKKRTPAVCIWIEDKFRVGLHTETGGVYSALFISMLEEDFDWLPLPLAGA